MTLKNLDDLEASWAEWLVEKNDRGKLTQGGAWRRDNPGEWEKLRLYYEQEATRPSLATRTGKQMVELVDGIIEAWEGEQEPPPTQPPPSGSRKPLPPNAPFTEKSGDQFFRDGDGLTTEHLFVTSAPGYGIGNMRWPYTGPSTGTWQLRDCKVKDVAANPPKSMDGTGEVGIWAGEKTVGERLEVWNCAWMAMWTGAACKGSRFTDIDIHDNPLIGLYMEHISTDVEFKRSNFGGSRLGVVNDHSSSINVEWWYQDDYGATLPYNGRSGSFSCRFIDCDIWCPPSTDYRVAGAFLDAGTFDFLFQNCRFWGPGKSVGHPRNLVDPSKPNRFLDCKFENAGGGPYLHDNVIG